MVLIRVKSLDGGSDELDENNLVAVVGILLQEQQVTLQLMLQTRDRVITVYTSHDNWTIMALEERVEVLILAKIVPRTSSHVHVRSKASPDLFEWLSGSQLL